MLMPWSWHINIIAFICDVLSLVLPHWSHRCFHCVFAHRTAIVFFFLLLIGCLTPNQSENIPSHTSFKQLSFSFFDNWTWQFMYLKAQNVTLGRCFGVLYMRNYSFRLLREACIPRSGPAHRLSSTLLEWHLWHLTFISTDYLFRPISYILNLWNGPRTCTSMHNKLTVCCSSSPERGEMVEIKTRDRPESSHSQLTAYTQRHSYMARLGWRVADWLMSWL